MLRTISPNISVITNFGCRAKCWYCIWKGHELEKVNQPTDWAKLTQFLSKNKNKGKVSVSGGGDSLYKFDTYNTWWENFLLIANSLNLIVDVHTREKLRNQDSFWHRINRCVFSSDKIQDDMEYLEYLSTLTKIRITHLVTADTTFELIDKYLEFQNKINCQFTIKELINYSDNGMYKKIREKYPNIFNLDAGDYNIYYMPDNSVRTTFLP
jgi:ABC-type glycerol-3-phosphate transport system substrate-binding protein